MSKRQRALILFVATLFLALTLACGTTNMADVRNGHATVMANPAVLVTPER